MLRYLYAPGTAHKNPATGLQGNWEKSTPTVLRSSSFNSSILHGGVAGFLISVLRNENTATFPPPPPDQCESVQISGEVLSSSGGRARQIFPVDRR